MLIRTKVLRLGITANSRYSKIRRYQFRKTPSKTFDKLARVSSMDPRMTLQTQLILQALLQHPAEELWGRKLAELTGLMPGTAQPILMRLERAGWVKSHREPDEVAHAAGRPARRYFALTGEGALKATAALADARRPKPSALRGLIDQAGLLT